MDTTEAFIMSLISAALGVLLGAMLWSQPTNAIGLAWDHSGNMSVLAYDSLDSCLEFAILENQLKALEHFECYPIKD